MSFQEDTKASRALGSTMGKRVLGVECPIRNNTGEVCNECARVKVWWRGGGEDEKRARDHQAKESYFLNIQKRDGEFAVLKIGKKVAKSLAQKLTRYKERTSKAFGFANLEEGEWVSIAKSGDHPNFEYDFEQLGEKADSVSADTVKGLPSLNNLTKDFNDGVIDIVDISGLSSGDSYEFRMLPIPTGDSMATEMVFRYYHWRCSEAEIIGGSPIDVKTAETPEEFKEYMPDAETTTNDTGGGTTYTLDDPPGCFGHFDGDDDDADDEDEARRLSSGAPSRLALLDHDEAHVGPADSAQCPGHAEPLDVFLDPGLLAGLVLQ